MTTIAPPPPPASPPPVLSSNGRTGIRVALIVAAAVVVVGTVTALGVIAFGVSTFRAVTDTQALPPDVRSLTVDSGVIPVAVRITADTAATAPRVDLRMIASTRSDRQRLAITDDAAGSRVVVGGDSSTDIPWSRAAQVTVVLPHDVARRLSVTVEQHTGMLSTDADLDQLIVRGTDGEARLGGSARRLEVHLRHGDITTGSPIAVTETVAADTQTGDITLAFRSAPRVVEAVSGSGDVTVELPGPGPYRVRAQSEGRHGDTTVTVPETTDAKSPEVTARSNDGDVAVTELR